MEEVKQSQKLASAINKPKKPKFKLVANTYKGKRDEFSTRIKNTKQTHVLPAATEKLKHLEVELGDDKDITKYCQRLSYNNLVKDLSRVECYVCGGPGHFMEVCPL